MKFANKLFFTMTALLTIIFAVFGMWMLLSYYSKAVEREIDRANAESGMFQLMFDNTYYPMAMYGKEFAVRGVMDSISFGVEKNGNYCVVWDDEREYYCNPNIGVDVINTIYGVSNTLDRETGNYAEDENYYGVAIRKIGSRYYIITVSKTEFDIYLGMCRDITAVYEAREELTIRYCIALGILLVVGGAVIFILSRYITRPISRLNHVVNDITQGNYEIRCDVKGNDEIGKLAANFNEMTNAIVDHMHQKELEALQKENFTTSFAHELKTPLTSIIGYADMLNTVEMTDRERSEAYYYIFTQGKRLENLSHKLLELAEIDKNPIKKDAIPTKELEENLRNTMRPIFAAKKVEGDIHLDKGYIYGDKELLLSVFYNLLDNAVKAVEENGEVHFKGMNLMGDYEITVTDNGRGIPEEEISRITEAFYMVDKSRSRKEGGAGIGMALCQKIIQCHDAKMHIHSKLGEGTVIRVVFTGQEENK
ncbi:MAG: HAMP domain-containing histidine kinase [Lachnospiraceae bacterium]|nr:HAMP domain-containing histidine kinase [Lachnospiraceae bacterium]